MAKTGAQWRELPERFGNWNTIYRRFNEWSKKNIWAQLLEICIEDPDLENIMIDATITRAHACSAGYGSQEEQGLGRSAGGFSSKIHAKVDALGNLLKIIITPGQQHDSTQAKELLDKVFDSNVLADRGYDSDEIRAQIKAQNCISVIPPRSNRIVKIKYDKDLYKDRNRVECFFSKMKHFRRVFCRYEKSKRNFVSFISFVGAILWLR
jgi:transposase